MKKWLMYALLVTLVGGSWFLYARTGNEIKDKTELVRQLQEMGDPEGKGAKLATDIQGIEGQRIFTGVILAFLSAGLVGIVFVLQILPSLAHRFTHAIYDSAEMMDNDVMHDARSLLAQGDYEGAIEAFRHAAAAEPMNRLPWVEIVKVYKDHLGNPAAAVQTIRHALESQEWEINDAAYFLFRLAELYDEVEGDRASAIAIMQQVIDQFPGTRHSANASHKLYDWELEAAAASAAPAEPEPLS
ncbi:MAG: tetratricopeptide repeat protein [Verrucomicrobiota bacterium]